MASVMPSAKPAMNGHNHQTTEQGWAETLVKAVTLVSDDIAYQSIASLVDKNDKLSRLNTKLLEELKETEIVMRRNFAEIQKIGNDNDQKSNQVEELKTARSEGLEQIQKSQAEVTSLREQLETTSANIDKVMKKNKANEERMSELTKKHETDRQTLEDNKKFLVLARAQLEEEKKQCDEQRQQLDIFKSKAFPLKNTTQAETRAEVSAAIEQFRSLFDEAYRLVQRFFGRNDLDSRKLSSAAWQRLGRDDRISGIPLVPANSEAAIHMRIAAILRLLAVSASTHIFHPVYLTTNDVDLRPILESLYITAPSQAQCLRSVLLNCEPKLQTKNGKARAQAVVDDITQSVDFLIAPSDGTKQFDAALSVWCNKALDTWMALQQLDVMIHSLFEPENKHLNPTEWKALPSSASLAQSNRANGGPLNGTKLVSQPQGDLVVDQVVAQVWPAFLATNESGEYSLAKNGYVLMKAQVEVAKKDAGAALAPERPPRLERNKQRRGGKSSAENLHSFLSKPPQGH